MPIEDESNPSANNPFVSGQAEFDHELNQRSRVVVTPDAHELTPQKKPSNWSELSPKEKRRLVGFSAGAAALTVAAVAGGPEIVDRLNGPEYSPETTTYTVQDGDGWYDVIEAIDGYEAVHRTELIDHVKADPANIDFLTNDDLHPGQSIVIPVSVEK